MIIFEVMKTFSIPDYSEATYIVSATWLDQVSNEFVHDYKCRIPSAVLS